MYRLVRGDENGAKRCFLFNVLLSELNFIFVLRIFLKYIPAFSSSTRQPTQTHVLSTKSPQLQQFLENFTVLNTMRTLEHQFPISRQRRILCDTVVLFNNSSDVSQPFCMSIPKRSEVRKHLTSDTKIIHQPQRIGLHVAMFSRTCVSFDKSCTLCAHETCCDYGTTKNKIEPMKYEFIKRWQWKQMLKLNMTAIETSGHCSLNRQGVMLWVTEHNSETIRA